VFKEGLPRQLKALAVSACKEQGNELVNIDSDFMKFYIFLTVHLRIILVSDQHDAQFFL
jgi:hypothetical protein